MHSTTQIRHRVLCFVSALLITITSIGVASAGLVVNTHINDTSDIFFPVSDSDLIGQGQPSFLSLTTVGFSSWFGSDPENLNDGTLGNSLDNGSLAHDIDDTWSATFHLNLADAPLGFTITQIDTHAGWSVANIEQSYEVLYSTVGDSEFTSLGFFSFFPTYTGFLHSTLIEITGTSGTIVTNVNAIRFDFLGQVPLGSAMREIDVFGYATVPEPSSAAFLLLSCMGFWQRRRRSR